MCVGIYRLQTECMWLDMLEFCLEDWFLRYTWMSWLAIK